MSAEFAGLVVRRSFVGNRCVGAAHLVGVLGIAAVDAGVVAACQPVMVARSPSPPRRARGGVHRHPSGRSRRRQLRHLRLGRALHPDGLVVEAGCSRFRDRGVLFVARDRDHVVGDATAAALGVAVGPSVELRVVRVRDLSRHRRGDRRRQRSVPRCHVDVDRRGRHLDVRVDDGGARTRTRFELVPAGRGPRRLRGRRGR